MLMRKVYSFLQKWPEFQLLLGLLVLFFAPVSIVISIEMMAVIAIIDGLIWTKNRLAASGRAFKDWRKERKRLAKIEADRAEYDRRIAAQRCRPVVRPTPLTRLQQMDMLNLALSEKLLALDGSPLPEEDKIALKNQAIDEYEQRMRGF